jgi:ABC-type phosphate/phosphonate transport system ATPase subunit
MSTTQPRETNGLLVNIEGVDKLFRRGTEEIHILEKLNLQVRTGEFLALMGPSGSGKTTLLNLIGGLDRPTRGSVEIQGERIDQLSDRKLAAWRAQHVGLVFQLYNLLPVPNSPTLPALPSILPVSPWHPRVLGFFRDRQITDLLRRTLNRNSAFRQSVLCDGSAVRKTLANHAPRAAREQLRSQFP